MSFWVARIRRGLRHIFRDSIAVLMLLVSRRVFRINVRGHENWTYQPGTIIAFSHRHDLDIPIITPILFLLPRRFAEMHRLYAATRDDLFETGFLCLYFARLDWFRPAIAKLCIDGLFYACQAGPVKLPDEQTVNQLLQEFRRTEADFPLDVALTDEWLARLVGQGYTTHARTMADTWPPFVPPRPQRIRRSRLPSLDRPPLAEPDHIMAFLNPNPAEAAEASLERGLAAVKKDMEQRGTAKGRGPDERAIVGVVAERTVQVIIQIVWPMLRKVGLPLRVLLWLARATRPNPNKRLVISDAILRAPLPVLAEYATPRMFREPLASRMRERHHNLLHRQLGFLTRVLDKNGYLMIAPEGRVTPDGRFGKMRAALTRVVQQAKNDPVMLPINLTYDFIDSARPHVFVSIGTEITGLKAAARIKNDLADIVRYELAGRATITLSQLASAYIVAAAGEGRDSVPVSDILTFVRETAMALQAYGLVADARLNDAAMLERRLRGFISFGASNKADLFQIELGGQITDVKTIAALKPVLSGLSVRLNHARLLRIECRNWNDNPTRYCLNELASLLAAHNIADTTLTPICARYSDVPISAKNTPNARRERSIGGDERAIATVG